MSVGLQCGYVAILGRPNVGKSTLLNRILGRKLSITSRRPQTTRHRILGIKSNDTHQVIYVDTPGLHFDNKQALNRRMNKTAASAVHDVDIIVFVLAALHWTKEDELVLSLLQKSQVPVLVVVNKVDKVTDKARLLPYLTMVQETVKPTHLIALSAKSGANIDILESHINTLLPASDFFYFPVETVTDKPDQFMISEMIREKIMRALGQELPYATTVQVQSLQKRADGLISISALILVERDSQKGIVVGEGGLRLREIGRQARIDMEKWLNAKVFLRLWVKVKSNWSDDERALKQLGYDDEG